MPKIIAIASLTPGSGKSTVFLNLAASLSIYEKKNLMVDFDCNSDLSKVVRSGIADDKIMFENLYPFTDFIPSGFEEGLFFKKIAGDCSRTKNVFETFMDAVSKEYEYVIFDIPSKMDFLSTSALAVCDEVIIVKRNRHFDLEGIQRLLLTIFQINRCFEKKINIRGILTWGHAIPIEASFKPWPVNIDPHILKIFIPLETKTREKETAHIPFCFIDILSPVSVSFLELCREIIA